MTSSDGPEKANVKQPKQDISLHANAYGHKHDEVLCIVKFDLWKVVMVMMMMMRLIFN